MYRPIRNGKDPFGREFVFDEAAFHEAVKRKYAPRSAPHKSPLKINPAVLAMKLR